MKSVALASFVLFGFSLTTTGCGRYAGLELAASSGNGSSGGPAVTVGSDPSNAEDSAAMDAAGNPTTTSPGTNPGTGPGPSTTTVPEPGDTGAGGCRVNADCGGDTPVCAPSGDCVGCTPNGTDCPPGEYCTTTTLECVPGCDDDSDCGQVCNVETHQCVVCLDDSHCEGRSPFCDSRFGFCVDCLSDDDCAAPTSVCDPTMTCVAECILDGDCPTGRCVDNECDSQGYACMDDTVCDTDAGEECCTEEDCFGHCMIPCGNSSDCPPMVPAMGCGHGYCLFPCDNDDSDCAQWPGFTCEHFGTLCESG